MSTKGGNWSVYVYKGR